MTFTESVYGHPIYRAPAPIPCAYCGNDTPQVSHLQAADAESCDVFAGECGRCGASGPTASSALEAAELWNSRRTVAP